MLPFNFRILLWSFHTIGLMQDAMIIIKGKHIKFLAIIISNSFNIVVMMIRNMMDEYACPSINFLFREIAPSMPSGIINNSYKIFKSVKRDNIESINHVS